MSLTARYNIEPLPKIHLVRSAQEDKCAEILRLFYSPKERTEDDFNQELILAKLMLTRAISMDLRSYQEVALLSLLADIVGGHAKGKTSFEASKLLEHFNAGMNQLAASEFFTFVYIRGKVDKRLWSKRNCEQLLFRRGWSYPLTNSEE